MSLHSPPMQGSLESLTEKSSQDLTASFEVLERTITQLLAQADDDLPLDITRLQEQLATITYQLESVSLSEELKARLEIFEQQLSPLIEKFSSKTQQAQQALMFEDRRHHGIRAYSQNQTTHLRNTK